MLTASLPSLSKIRALNSFLPFPYDSLPSLSFAEFSIRLAVFQLPKINSVGRIARPLIVSLFLIHSLCLPLNCKWRNV